ncbi:vanomycin resistance protein VanB [Amycolatopsis sp. K13G38]|uniref:Vanomycin resistance protein VanB n=1 Tax=Amycolatopsis acididurans TaxID=2724524 RepID=A0ABX1JGK8_9PSEU|nr:VanW family protein [Amycolatopsis acididurans]NKQ58519.1 vanomycin resistance protein VanB [Amycolatopsis acididurans]
MRDDHYWPSWDGDADPPTQRIIGPPPSTEFLDAEPLDPEDALVGELLDTGRARRRRQSPGKRFLGRVLLVTGGVLAAGVLLYTVDLVLSAGHVPRGVMVAGVDVGGMSRADAESKLRRELEPRLTVPVPVTAGDARATLDPVESGLGLDWATTLANAGHQPLDPIARITSFFTTRNVDVVTTSDADELNQAVAKLAAERLNHPPTEGSIGFDTEGGAVTAYAVEPRAGQTLTDVHGAANLLKARWLDKTGVPLPMTFTPVKATSQGVRTALDRLVEPAIAKPVHVHGNGVDTTLDPPAIAAAMRFVAHDGGALEVQLAPDKLQHSLQPKLASTEKPGKDAQIVFDTGAPTVVPSEDASKIDWNDTFKPLMDVLVKPDGRDLPVRYQGARPKLSTDDANALGVKEVVGEFTTDGLSGPDADNVRAMAAKVNGALVKPGETFSLADRVGSFGSGFVAAPVNEDGTGPIVQGGGSSQFATTLYNAEYFAGLTDAGHTDHSSYLDRYPPARDAVAVRDDGSMADLRFTNNLTSGVAIQAISSGSSVTVRLWGTKQYRVESDSGPRQDLTPPPIQQQPPGCRPTMGEPGFTATDTRVVYDTASGAEVRRDTRTVHYAPQPLIFC